MNKLEKVLQKTLKKYPELKDYRISVKYAALNDSIAEYRWVDLKKKRVNVRIDYALRFKDEPIKRAAIASELSHLLKDRKLSRFGHYMTNFEFDLYTRFKFYRQLDEKQTDIITVARGFGKGLFELLIYKMKTGIDSNREDYEGLTIEELKQVLKITRYCSKRKKLRKVRKDILFVS